MQESRAIQKATATCWANHRSEYDRDTHTSGVILTLSTNSIFASFNDTFVHVTDMSGKETVTRVTGKFTPHDIVLCMHQSSGLPLPTTKSNQSWPLGRHVTAFLTHRTRTHRTVTKRTIGQLQSQQTRFAATTSYFEAPPCDPSD
jgi:hypothetical protein